MGSDDGSARWTGGKRARTPRLPRWRVPVLLVAICCVSSCSPAEDSATVTALQPFLVSADDACRAVDSANDLMASANADERSEGRTLAAEIWGTAAESDELANWLRRQCGATSLEMAYEAELSVNGSVPGSD